MNDTPEGRPPAFPHSGPGATGGSSRADRRGLPTLPGRGLTLLAKEWPRPLAKEWRRARGGIWRVTVDEESMAPALAAGDWLLLDPTSAAWPRRGSIVVFREPDSTRLAVKRVAGRPGDRVRISAGILHLATDEAWLLGDNREASVDSRRYGPVPLEALVGRAWFRYAPAGRVGRLDRREAVKPGR